MSMSWSSCSTLPCQSVFHTRRNFCWTIVSRSGSGRFRAVVIGEVDEWTGTRIGNWKLDESEWSRVHERQFTYCLARRKSTENVCCWNSWSASVLRCKVRSNRRRINVWDKFETISRSPWQQTVAEEKKRKHHRRLVQSKRLFMSVYFWTTASRDRCPRRTSSGDFDYSVSTIEWSSRKMEW